MTNFVTDKYSNTLLSNQIRNPGYIFFSDNFIEMSRRHIKLGIHQFCEDLIAHKRQMLDGSPWQRICDEKF